MRHELQAPHIQLHVGEEQIREHSFLTKCRDRLTNKVLTYMGLSLTIRQVLNGRWCLPGTIDNNLGPYWLSVPKALLLQTTNPLIPWPFSWSLNCGRLVMGACFEPRHSSYSYYKCCICDAAAVTYFKDSVCDKNQRHHITSQSQIYKILAVLDITGSYFVIIFN